MTDCRAEGRWGGRGARQLGRRHTLREGGQQTMPSTTVVEVPMEVVERMLPLLPACTLLRSRAVCR